MEGEKGFYGWGDFGFAITDVRPRYSFDIPDDVDTTELEKWIYEENNKNNGR